MRRHGSSPHLFTAILATLLLTALSVPVDAQSMGDRLRRNAEARVDRAIDQAIDRSLDAVECVITDLDCIERAQAEGNDVLVVDTEGNPVSGSAGAPGEGEWLNFDFTPGDRILFFDDFTNDAVGDFPRRFDLVSGNFEIAERGGVRWLRASSFGELHVMLPEVLPEMFTLEMDVILTRNNHQYIYFSPDGNAPAAQLRAHPNGGEAGIEGGGRRAIAPAPDAVPGRPFRLAIMADGDHVKMYIGSTRVANVPNADLGRMNKIRLVLSPFRDEALYIGNVRVAAGGRDLYDALAETGRIATQGILFDVGSDRIRPESTPTLEEIGEMLSQHPDLSLTIEGHTDSAGDEAANQSLSERRAASVKAYLVERHGVEEDRIEARGLGESQPVVSNDTPEGRQQNRRVELVRR